MTKKKLHYGNDWFGQAQFSAHQAIIMQVLQRETNWLDYFEVAEALGDPDYYHTIPHEKWFAKVNVIITLGHCH